MSALIVLACAVAYAAGLLGTHWSAIVVWLCLVALAVHLQRLERVRLQEETDAFWKAVRNFFFVGFRASLRASPGA